MKPVFSRGLITLLAVACLALGLAASPAQAQVGGGIYAYPQQGQSP